MRAAPPVSVQCTGGVAWRAAQTAAYALATAVGAVWLLQWCKLQDSAAAGAWTGAGVLVAAGCLAVMVAAAAWRGSRQGLALLVWDGQRWTIDTTPVTTVVMVDLGGWLLLRLRTAQPTGTARTRWLAVSAADAGAALHGLRAALFALTPSSPGARRG